jgi:hypothetical protein
MITKIIQIDGSEHAIAPNGDVRKRACYQIKSADVTANGNGTYSIPGITDAKNADLASAMDTCDCYKYDEELQAWWMQ